MNNFYNLTDEDIALLLEDLKYVPVNWKDRDVEKPNTWNERDLGNGDMHHKRADGYVIEPGTKRNAKNLGNMDLGIYLLFLQVNKHSDLIESLQLQVTNLHNAVFNNLTDNIFKFSFADLNHIEIVDGWYDEKKKEVKA